MSEQEAARTYTAGGHQVRITRPEKTLFPDEGRTKADLAEHYQRVAPRLLPTVEEHPVALHRFPDGVHEHGFFQKQLPAHTPSWLPSVTVPRETGGTVTMPLADGVAPLLWFAGQASVELHPLLSTARSLDSPDRMIFDLDPPGEDFAEVRWAAVRLHELLRELSLPGYPMTTGSRGLHVVVPLQQRQDFNEVREFAMRVAVLLATRHPERLTSMFRKSERGGRLFVDVLRNQYAQHAVAPYSVRARPGAPVATPLAWEELDGLADARRWSLSCIRSRLAQADPWAGMRRHAHTLGPARRRLARLEL